MKIYYSNSLTGKELKELTKRPAINIDKTFSVVRPILDEIKQNGLSSALLYARKFDQFTGNNLTVSQEEFEEAEKALDTKIKKALERAAANIHSFHSKQFPSSYSIETMNGVVCSREFRAIENVGLYIPGGSAVLPSTMLMLGIPAQIAGCKRIITCSPARDEGVNHSLLYAAKLCGVTEFYKIGGAQAIALIAYGDMNIKKADKIFGPGNQYVTAAKMLVSIDSEGCAIDLPAGPSEVLIIADENANPSFIAADLLSQAEHGSDSQVILLTTSESISDKVIIELNEQLKVLPRKELAAASIVNSFIMIVNSVSEALQFSNEYAPEHLILHVNEPEGYTSQISNAGSVFLGSYSPESAGDYASGTNHSLPTYGWAKTFGGVSVESFMKGISFQSLTKDGLQNIAETIEILAGAEGLQAHKNAVTIRLKE